MRRRGKFWTEERLASDYAVEYAHKLYAHGLKIADIAHCMETSEEYAEHLLEEELPEDYVDHIPKEDEKYFKILVKLYKFRNMDPEKKGEVGLLLLLCMFILGFISHKQLSKLLWKMKRGTGLFAFEFKKHGAAFVVEGKNIFGKTLRFVDGYLDYPDLAAILAKNMEKNPKGCMAFAEAMADAGLHKEAEKLFKGLGWKVSHF